MQAVETEFEKIEKGMRDGGAAVDQALGNASQKVNDMSASIDATAAGFRETIVGTAESLKGTLAVSGEEFGKAVAATGEAFGRTLADASNNFADDVEDAASGISDILEKIETQTNKQREFVGSLEAVGANLGGQAKLLETALRNMSAQQQAFAEVSQQLTETVKSATKDMTTSQSQIAVELQKGLEIMLDQGSELTDQQRKLIEQAQQVEAITKDHLNKIAENLEKMHEKVRDILVQSDVGLSTAVGSMSGSLNAWIEHQEEANDMLAENIDNLRSVLQELPALRAPRQTAK